MSTKTTMKDAASRRETRKPRTRAALALAIAAFGLAGTAFAYDANFWQPVNGDWNGNWSDTRHWSKGRVPVNPDNKGDDAILKNTSGHEITITVDKDFTQGDDQAIPAFIKIGDRDDELECAPVRLVGSGKLTQCVSYIYQYANTHLIVDGSVEIAWTGGWGIHTNSTLEVCGSALVDLTGNTFSVERDATLTLAGDGWIKVNHINPKSGSTVRVAGGTFQLLTGATTLDPGATFEMTGGVYTTPNSWFNLKENSSATISGGEMSIYTFGGTAGVRHPVRITGGTVNIKAGIASDLFVGDDFMLLGGMLHQTVSTISYVGVLPAGPEAVYWHDYLGSNPDTFAADFCRPFRGHYIQTNHTAWVRFDAADGVAYGGGTLDASILSLKANSGITLDLERIDLDYGSTLYANAQLYLPRDIAIGCFGPYSNNGGAANCQIKVPGKITYETTDCFDPTKSHNVQNGNLARLPGMEVAVTGAGKLTYYGGPKLPYDYPTMASLALGEGSTLDVHAGNDIGIGDNERARRYGRVTLGAGATYQSRTDRHVIEATELTLGAGAKVKADLSNLACREATTQGNGWASIPVLTAAKTTGVEKANIVTSSPKAGTDWVLIQAGPNFALRDRNFEPLAAVDNFTWTNTLGSATACKLDEAANYFFNDGQEQRAPGENDIVFFRPIDVDKSHEVIVPEGGMTVNRISLGGYNGSGAKIWRRSSDPYYFKGGKLTLKSAGGAGWSAGFYDCTPNPAVFECDVEGSGSQLSVGPYTFVAFNGAFTAKKMPFFGTVVFGGTASITGAIDPQGAYSGSRESSITVLDGGSLTIGNQNASFKYNHSILVEAGGTATVGGTVWGSGATRFDHIVNGTLNLNAPLQASGTTTALFTGTGTVKVSAFLPAAASTGTVELARSVRINAGALNTACSDGSMRLKVQSFQKPTLGATADWTYGPAVATTTEAADRALTLDVGAELAVDTTDPVDSTVGHNVTIADPVNAAKLAKLVKRGKGSLKLASSANTFGELAGVSVEADTFAWSASQTLGTLTAAAGTKLSAIATDGNVPVLTVNSDVDLNGVQIALKGTSSVWADVVKVPAGKHIVGTPVTDTRLKIKVVTTPDGGEALQAKSRKGCVVIVY